MDIALGVSVTGTTVHMVLVEGARADGVTIETDVFDTSAVDGAVAPSTSEQVSAAILATQTTARRSGHDVIATGLVIDHDADADDYRYSLAARGIDDVTLVSGLQAAGALANAVGRAIGYSATGFVFINGHTATLSVVEGADQATRELASRTLNDTDPLSDLRNLLTCLDVGERTDPQGLFVIGSGMDLVAVKSRLQATSTRPVIVPEEPEWALARGAALVAATAPRFEASTAGLAYTQDPEEALSAGRTPLPTGPLALADAITQLGASVENRRVDPTACGDAAPLRHRPLLPVGSLAAAIMVLAVVSLVMAFASTVEPAANRSSSMEAQVVLPSPPPVIPPPQPPLASQSAPVASPGPTPLAAPTTPAQRPPSPQQASAPVARPSPRTVVAQAPAPQVHSQQSAPEEVSLPATAIAPAAAEPAIVGPSPAAAPAPPIAAAMPSAPVIPAPPVDLPRIAIYPIQAPPLTQAPGGSSPWSPPSLWIQPPQTQQPQTLQAQQDPPWIRIPLWPLQQTAQIPTPPQAVRPTIPVLPRTPQWPQSDSPQWPQSPSLSPSLSPPSPPPQSTWVPDYPWPTYSDGSASPRTVQPTPVGDAPVWPWPRV